MGTRVAVCQDWLESERGWGTRPDGHSLHLSFVEHGLFIKAYWARMPKDAPEEYSRECGDPYWVYVDEETHEKLKKNKRKHGVRVWQHEQMSLRRLEGGDLKKAILAEVGDIGHEGWKSF